MKIRIMSDDYDEGYSTPLHKPEIPGVYEEKIPYEVHCSAKIKIKPVAYIDGGGFPAIKWEQEPAPYYDSWYDSGTDFREDGPIYYKTLHETAYYIELETLSDVCNILLEEGGWFCLDRDDQLILVLESV